MEKEFNLSECLKFKGRYYYDEDIKEFIKRDTELINDFACGGITLKELKKEREKLIGDL